MLNRLHRSRRPVLARTALASLSLVATCAAEAVSLKDQAPQQVVLQLADSNKSTLDAVVAQLKAAGFNVKVTDRLPNRPVYLLTIGKSRTGQQAVDFLDESHDLAIEFSEVNQLVTSDPWLHDSTHAKLNSVLAIGDGVTCIDDITKCEPDAVREILRLDEAHAIGQGAGIRVAVLDTGTDWNHPDFLDIPFVGQRDFIDKDFDAMEGGVPITDPLDFGKSSVGHGTHVAGIVHRVAPKAELMLGRVLDPSGTGTTWLTAKGVFWAIDPTGLGQPDTGAHVINLSLDTRVDTQVMRLAANVVTCRAIPNRQVWAADYDRCHAEGLQAVVVAAVGNDASGKYKLYPAAYSAFMPGMLAVAASDNTVGHVRHPAYFTNHGSYVDVAAPGYAILSQFYDDSHATISGTSMAAPFVSGLAALVKGLGPTPNDWTAAAVVQRIKSRGVSMCGIASPTFTHVDVAATVDDTLAPLGNCPP